MQIDNISASSYKCHDECPLKYFGSYVLKWRGPSGKAADKGTIVHKVLEVLARTSSDSTRTVKKDTDDDIFGDGPFDTDQKVNLLIEQVYQHYTGKLVAHEWESKDFKDCSNWVWKTLHYNSGQFDPRKLDIVGIEKWFELDIAEPWAILDTGDDEDERFLRIRGFIDLVLKHGDGCYEIIDWKTGQSRKDWVTGELKDESNLFDDVQVRLYHYAITKMYDADIVMITLFFINAGGPYTVSLTQENIKETERIIRSKYEFISGSSIITRNRSWKCNRFCYFGTTDFKNTNKHIMTDNGAVLSKCDQLYYEINKKGFDIVMKEYKNE